MYKTILLMVYGSVIELRSAQCNEEQQQLVYVLALWRHGDRAPNGLPYPKDPYNETKWPRGWAQLTNIGMMQMYELGQFFQKRYAHFISHFSLEDVSMISSKSDRAIVSGQAMYRGFFPALGQEQWLPGEQWQPLPFHIAPTTAILKPTSFDCPEYDHQSEEENEALYKNISAKYANFFQFLANVTGYKVVNFKKAAGLYDIQREIDHSMPQPPWVYRKWPEYGDQSTLEIITDLKRIRRISLFNSPEKARLRGGLLMEHWLSRVKNVSLELPLQPRKMQLYSAHDGTVLSLMYALGVGNDLLVPYASCLIMEVYRNADNYTTMKLFFKNGTNESSVYQLALPGCDPDNCTISEVQNAVAPRIVKNQKQLDLVCGISSGVTTLLSNKYLIMAWITAVSLHLVDRRHFYGAEL